MVTRNPRGGRDIGYARLVKTCEAGGWNVSTLDIDEMRQMTMSVEGGDCYRVWWVRTVTDENDEESPPFWKYVTGFDLSPDADRGEQLRLGELIERMKACG